MVDFKRAVVRELGGAGTGVLLDPEIGVGPAIADGSLAGGTGLIVAVEATGYEGPPGARVSRVLPGLGRRAGEAPGRVRGQAARLLPPGRAERRGPGAARRRGRRRVPRGRPRAVPRAALVRAGRRQAARARTAGVSSSRRRRRLTALGRRHPQGGVPLRCRGDRRDPLGGGVRGAGRRDAAAVGAPLRRRRRRDVRAPGRGRVPRRRERRPRGPLGVGGGGDACPAGARTPSSPAPGGTGSRGSPRSSTTSAAPWRPRWTAARAPEPPGPGWYAAVLSPPPRCATSTCSSSASSTRTSSSRTRIPVPVFGQAERLVDDVRLTLGSSSAITACGAARLGLRVAMVGVVGDDPLGRFVLEALRRPGRRHQRLPRRAGPAHGRVGHPRQRHRSRDPHGAGHDRRHARDRRARRAARSRAPRARRAACSSSPGSPCDCPGAVPGGARRRRDDEPRPQLGPVGRVGRRVRRRPRGERRGPARTPARRCG